MKVRLVDCVGYLVPGVLGDKEEGEERMVSTPWAEEQIPFSRAAELGTEKVIHDHSVVGVVVTTDGSFGELPRENFVEAEEKTVAQLKAAAETVCGNLEFGESAESEEQRAGSGDGEAV